MNCQNCNTIIENGYALCTACELRFAGIRSNVIDLLLRHQVAGIEGHRSTADRSLAACFAEIVAAQEKVLTELGIKPLVGLAKN